MICSVAVLIIARLRNRKNLEKQEDLIKKLAYINVLMKKDIASIMYWCEWIESESGSNHARISEELDKLAHEFAVKYNLVFPEYLPEASPLGPDSTM